MKQYYASIIKGDKMDILYKKSLERFHSIVSVSEDVYKIKLRKNNV